MKVMFHTNTLNYRGTTVAVTDYAKYNQELLGNESIIAYCKSFGQEKDMGNEPAVIESLEKQFNVVNYRAGNFQNLIDIHKPDVCYFISNGVRSSVELPTNCKTAVHAVFQVYDPHGDSYAYISKWLSDTMSEGKTPYVPHIVDLPTPTGNYREALGIGKDKTVVGRIGGYTTFDIPFVKETVSRLARNTNDFVFLFVGTEPFDSHPNIKFVNEIYSTQKKSNFINTCDVMLHGRQRGESFGLSVAEFLSLNKPVLAWNGGLDLNHVEMLKDTGLLYNNSQDIIRKLYDVKTMTTDWYKLVEDYKPNIVMEKFKKVFL